MRKLVASKKILFRTRDRDGEIYNVLMGGVLKAKIVFVEPGLKVYQLKDGTLLEFYGPGAYYPKDIFNGGNLVVSFKVKDLNLAVSQMHSTWTMLGKIERISKHYAYCYFRLANGNVIGLYQQQ